MPRSTATSLSNVTSNSPSQSGIQQNSAAAPEGTDAALEERAVPYAVQSVRTTSTGRSGVIGRITFVAHAEVDEPQSCGPWAKPRSRPEPKPELSDAELQELTEDSNAWSPAATKNDGVHADGVAHECDPGYDYDPADGGYVHPADCVAPPGLCDHRINLEWWKKHYGAYVTERDDDDHTGGGGGVMDDCFDEAYADDTE
jgi:hypothetical protein